MAFPASTFEPVGTSFIAWCVGVAGSKDICTLQKFKQHGFPCCLLFLYLYLYPLSRNIYMYVFVLFPLCVPSDLKIGYEKSILTRTETLSLTTCFKEPLLFIPLILKRTCFYLLFICYLLLLEHETRARCDFYIVTPKSCVRDNINWEIKSNYAREIREINPSLNYENLYFFVVKRNHFKLAYIVVYFHLICLSKELVTRH